MQLNSLVGIRLSLFNWIMQRARMRLGLTQSQLADLVCTDTGRISELETLKRWPSPELAADIADALGTTVDEMFPARLAEKVKENLGKCTSYRFAVPIDRVSLGSREILMLEAPDMLGEVEKDETIDAVLKTLRPRERTVLQLRFGLEDGRQRTLEEVGREFGLTREHIRQIEVKALRKLRHPSRSKKLKWFLSDDEPGGRNRMREEMAR